jgi:hypothetical protein
VVSCGNRQALDHAHIAGIQAGIHLHDGDAGFGVAGLDGAMNRRCTAPARQQAGVDVQAAQARRIEHPLRQDQAIGGHHHHIGLSGIDRGLGGSGVFGIFAVQTQAQRLGHGNAMLQRALLDGRGLQLHAAPGRTVRLGQHQRNFKTCSQQTLQGHARKFGRAGKNDFHGTHKLKRQPPAARCSKMRLFEVNALIGEHDLLHHTLRVYVHMGTPSKGIVQKTVGPDVTFEAVDPLDLGGRAEHAVDIVAGVHAIAQREKCAVSSTCSTRTSLCRASKSM